MLNLIEKKMVVNETAKLLNQSNKISAESRALVNIYLMSFFFNMLASIIGYFRTFHLN